MMNFEGAMMRNDDDHLKNEDNSLMYCRAARIVAALQPGCEEMKRE